MKSRAVPVCIVGRTSLSVEDHANEQDVLVTAELQRDFVIRMAGVIEAICI